MRKLFNLYKNIILIAIVFFYQSLNAQTFILKGTVTGKDSGYAVMRYFRQGINKAKSDTAIISKGKFEFTGEITGANIADFYIDTNTASKRKKYAVFLFLQPGTIKMNFSNGNVDMAVIKGSKIQKEYEALKKKQSKYWNEMTRLSALSNSVLIQMKEGKMNVKIAEEKIEEIDKEYRPIALLWRKGELTYIKEHPNSYVSFLLVYGLVGRISNDSIDMFYSMLSDKIKGSSLDSKFLEYNEKVRKAFAAEYPFTKLSLNDKAPHFTITNSLTTESRTPFDFKGKVVILEFWGIDCVPCLKANPHLEEIRRQYGKDKLEIIAINDNRNEDIDKTISYINKNKLTEWIHVFINDEVKQKAKLIFKGDFDNYFGLGVPRTVLIDKEGKVVYKNNSYTIEEMKSFKILVNKIINE